MQKVYVFLAEGFEEIEGLTVVDILRRAGIETVMVSIGTNRCVRGSHGITVEADILFEEVEREEALMYVLPGGMPGTRHLAEHKGLMALLVQEAQAGKKLAAICAAPGVLGELGLLNGQKASCYPGFEEKLTGAIVSEDAVSVSGNFTTSRGMGTAIPFALALTEQLAGRETAENLGKSIIWSI